jgi:Cys-rich repeat protein
MIFVSTQICVESSKISTSLGQAERAAAAREKRVQRGEAIIADCESNDECEGYCIQGKCVDAIDEHESARVEPTPAPAPLETPNVARCTADAQCGEGQSCMSGYCMSAPPPPSSLLQRATELYVRENAAQLRQDLALGEGPVIATLARWRRVSAKELGKLMRAHRESLTPMLGDRSDTKWAARFLEQLVVLQRASTARLPLPAKRGEGQG